MYTKEEIIEEIISIREEIGHEFVEPEIKEMYLNDNELTIIAPDRPEKSIIIGKGGWVVGKLREKLGLKSIHVISYTDIILREYQLDLSVKHVHKLLNEDKIPTDYVDAFNNLYSLLKQKQEAPYDNTIIERYVEDNIDRKCYENAKVIVALSGGVDSSFSTVLSKSLGFNIKAMTVDPGTIVLPKQFRFNIENLCNRINISHEYVETDMSEIIQDSLSGKIHPCGRCSKNIHETLEKQLAKNDCNVLIFGDLLSTGSQSIVVKNENIRINLPALFRMEKTEVKNIITRYDVKKVKGYGCPLIVQVHKKYPQYRPFSIQRVLRETRAGILEPGEALELIRTI
jgi:predicted PP-loop superfamily ATPase